MTPSEVIKAAYDRLADEHDEDVRSPLMRELRALLDGQKEIPVDAGVELQAVCKPGGEFVVSDQHGRVVRNVKTVAVFRDQSGQPILQINL